MSITEAIEKLERELALPKHFFNFLMNEDDWSFVVKLHALIEGAVSYLLVHQPGFNPLGDIFSSIELSNKKRGKIAFVKALELLDKDERRYIASLSELRNELIHNIANVTVNLKDYARKLNNKIRKLMGKF